MAVITTLKAGVLELRHKGSSVWQDSFSLAAAVLKPGHVLGKSPGASMTPERHESLLFGCTTLEAAWFHRTMRLRTDHLGCVS